jgi:hypothetical protein
MRLSSLTTLQLDFAGEKHPNEMQFKGILVRLDEPSTKPPNGSNGHKIIVPTDVAKRRLKTLLGMGLNYSSKLNTHDQQHKVGVIKKAWIEGKDLWVEGVVWKHDFPESEKDLKKPNLGMSMELGAVQVEDLKADTWILSDFFFLGATILDRNAAAYHKTLAIAAKADERRNGMKKKVTTTATARSKAPALLTMTPKQIADIAASAARAVGNELKTEFASELADLRTLVTGRDLAAAEEELQEIEGSDEEVENTEACDEPGMATKVKAAKMKKNEDEDDDEDDEDDDDDEMDAEVNSDIDKGDLEEMGPETEDDEDDDDEPGSFNKGAKNHGDDTTGNKKLGRNENKAVTGSAEMLKTLRRAVKVSRTLAAQVQELRLENAKIRKEFKRYKVQATKMSAETGRRSEVKISADVAGLFSKGGIDVGELKASGQKFSVADVDALITASGLELDAVKRIEIKNKIRNEGLMDEGMVDRSSFRLGLQ